uniref:Jacalin-type lectin domain-containing protein n=1 Tax=Oryzias latipes TaxID=8090 RepID=A0A3B3HRK1_ORYLA
MSYEAPLIIVGGQGGYPFSFNGAETGSLLKKLDVWVGPTQVRCITVYMFDGVQKTYGTARVAGDKMVSFTFEDDEFFSSLSLWPNNTKTRLGDIKFTTSKNRAFDTGRQSDSQSDEEAMVPPTPVDVGSGLCFGVQGRSGTEIDAFGFLFIKVTNNYLRRAVFCTGSCCKTWKWPWRKRADSERRVKKNCRDVSSWSRQRLKKSSRTWRNRPTWNINSAQNCS